MHSSPLALVLGTFALLASCCRSSQPDIGAAPRACAVGGGTVVIRGVVRDPSGALLRGVSVYVSSPPVQVATDTLGRYELTVRAGPIELWARNVGYGPRSLSTCADRRAGRVIIIDFVLEMQPMERVF